VLTSIVASSIGVAAIQRAIPHVNLLRFQIAGNWLVLLVAMSLTLGLNTERWGKDVSKLLENLPRQLNHLGHDSFDSSPNSAPFDQLETQMHGIGIPGTQSKRQG